MECVFMAVSDNSVTSISAAVETSTNVVILSENVDKFTLAFIAPLRAQDNSEL
jgi:hypothetical protein